MADCRLQRDGFCLSFVRAIGPIRLPAAPHFQPSARRSEFAQFQLSGKGITLAIETG